jgi:NADPH:quinone reductase
VVIQIMASSINHAEVHMRRGEWAAAAKVVGIKCVGLVKACPGGEFAIGAKVAALMGGYLCASRFQTRERRKACPNQDIMMS